MKNWYHIWNQRPHSYSKNVPISLAVKLGLTSVINDKFCWDSILGRFSIDEVVVQLSKKTDVRFSRLNQKYQSKILWR